MPPAAALRNLSITIRRDARDVAAFLAAPENFALWASGLGTLRQVGGQWLSETPEGRITLRFSAPNAHGIADHWVVPAQGPEIYVPMRVIANGECSELVFTLFRQPGMSDEKFAADADWVMRDLAALKHLLEEKE